MYPIIAIPEFYNEYISIETLKQNINSFTNVYNLEQKRENVIREYAMNQWSYKSKVNLLSSFLNFFTNSLDIELEEQIIRLKKTMVSNEMKFTEDFELMREKEKDLHKKNPSLRNYQVAGDSRSKFRSGVSENYFYTYLTNNFGSSVTNAFNLNGIYCPDFIFIDRNNKIKLAIEIDEPYAFEDRKPIHFIGSHDYKHSQYSYKEWFIIRFTEEQVVKHPQKCCNEIQFLILKIIRKARRFELFEAKDKTLLIREWTKQEAMNLASNNFREKYLKEYNIRF